MLSRRRSVHYDNVRRELLGWALTTARQWNDLPMVTAARDALAHDLLPATDRAPLDLTTPAWAHYFAGVDATFTQGETRARRRPRMPA